MDEKWIKENLDDYIRDGECVELPSGSYVEITSLADMFGDIKASYDELIKADDLGVDEHGIHRYRGYKDFFDELKDKNIL